MYDVNLTTLILTRANYLIFPDACHVQNSNGKGISTINIL